MSNFVDHRDVVRALDLLHFQEEAPGMVFWHPKGFALYRVLEEAVRSHARAQGYQEVRSPQIMRQRTWELSGHWDHFREGMFVLDDGASAVKPVSCPGHIYMLGRRAPSYRELPLRFFELGVVHRDELSGTLSGLLRARQFTQDDGHIFCEPDQARDEIVAFCRSVPAFYEAFGLGPVRIGFSTRPAKRSGRDDTWDWAEGVLEEALSEIGIEWVHQPGEGAFYGPKLEFLLEDREGRVWQCGTIQVDLVMPERFQIDYIDREGKRRRPVMLHRALYGSLERFLGMLLEQHGAALPAWLCPTQVLVLPVSDGQSAISHRFAEELRGRGLRVCVEEQGHLSARVGKTRGQGIPFVAVIGPREAQLGEVAIRSGRESQSMPIGDAGRYLAARCRVPAAVLGSTAHER